MVGTECYVGQGTTPTSKTALISSNLDNVLTVRFNCSSPTVRTIAAAIPPFSPRAYPAPRTPHPAPTHMTHIERRHQN